MSNYLSAFAEDLENMIEMKTALGYKKSTFIDRAHKFDEFCLKNFPEWEEDQALRMPGQHLFVAWRNIRMPLARMHTCFLINLRQDIMRLSLI